MAENKEKCILADVCIISTEACTQEYLRDSCTPVLAPGKDLDLVLTRRGTVSGLDPVLVSKILQRRKPAKKSPETRTSL